MNIYRFLVLVMALILLLALVILTLGVYNKDKKLIILSVGMVGFDISLYYLLGFQLFV